VNQLVSELPPAEGHGRLLQISAAKRIEAGARAMLVSIPDTMRLDVVPGDDMIRMIVRGLGDLTLVFTAAPGPGHTEIQLGGSSELSIPAVGSFGARIAVGDREGPELARIQIGSIRHPDQGVVAFTAQAIVDAELL
jgi:hypothetical protein